METSSGILEALQSQLDNYPAMQRFTNKYLTIPSALLVPQTLQELDTEFRRTPEIVTEALSFIDLVDMLSLHLQGQVDFVRVNTISSLCATRIAKQSSLLGKDTLSNYMFADELQVRELLENNAVVLALFIYANVSKFFYVSSK